MKRESFKSRLGFLLVSAGCAIGIGNVWRFPYVTGQNGGGIFVLFYLIFLVIMGLPVLTMELAVGRASRKSANIKNRQPIGDMYVKAPFEVPEFFVEIIEDELNVKNVEFKEDLSDFTSYTFKPQLKTVGPKYGKLLNGIRAHLAEINGREAMKELDNSGSLSFDIDGQNVVLSKEDLLIDTAQMEGYVTEEDSTVTVVLDTNLSEELIEEGFVREIISKIQTMRKEAGFEVMDKIVVYSMGNQKIEGYMKEYREEILSDVMASDIRFDEVKGYTKEWSINGEKVTLGVEKLS